MKKFIVTTVLKGTEGRLVYSAPKILEIDEVLKSLALPEIYSIIIREIQSDDSESLEQSCRTS